MDPVAHVFTHTRREMYVRTSSGVDDRSTGIGRPLLGNRWKPAPAQAEFDLHFNQQLCDIFRRCHQGQTALQEDSPVDTIFLDSHLQRFGTLAETRVLIDVNVQQHMIAFLLAPNRHRRADDAFATTRVFQVRFKPDQLSPFRPFGLRESMLNAVEVIVDETIHPKAAVTGNQRQVEVVGSNRLTLPAKLEREARDGSLLGHPIVVGLKALQPDLVPLLMHLDQGTKGRRRTRNWLTNVDEQHLMFSLKGRTSRDVIA